MSKATAYLYSTEFRERGGPLVSRARPHGQLSPGNSPYLGVSDVGRKLVPGTWIGKTVFDALAVLSTVVSTIIVAAAF